MSNDRLLLLDPWRPFKHDQVGSAVGFCSNMLGCPLSPIVGTLSFRTHEEWVENYESTSLNLELLTSEVGGPIIGYELPPSVIECLVEDGKPFLSLSVHYVRFLDDLLVSVRSNMSDLAELFNRRVVLDEFIYDSADELINKLKSPELEGLFFGDWMIEQLPLDASTISDKRFWGLDDVRDHFGISKFRILHHPHSRTRSVGGLRLSSYSMMANGGDELRLFGVSSSLTYEAKYFGRSSHRLIDHWARQNVKGTDEYVLSMSGVDALARYLSGSNDFPLNRPTTIRQCLGFDWSR